MVKEDLQMIRNRKLGKRRKEAPSLGPQHHLEVPITINVCNWNRNVSERCNKILANQRVFLGIKKNALQRVRYIIYSFHSLRKYHLLC